MSKTASVSIKLAFLEELVFLIWQTSTCKQGRTGCLQAVLKRRMGYDRLCGGNEFYEQATLVWYWSLGSILSAKCRRYPLTKWQRPNFQHVSTGNLCAASARNIWEIIYERAIDSSQRWSRQRLKKMKSKGWRQGINSERFLITS